MKPSIVARRLIANQKKINLLRGGARSGKTTAIIQLAAWWLECGYMGLSHIPEGTFFIIRQTFPAMRMTVLKEFISALHEIGLYNSVRHLRSINSFTYQTREVQFMSADDSEKLKGLDPALCFFNEADSIEYDTFNQIQIRLRHHLYLDYNPSNPDGYIKTKLEDHWLHKRDDMYLDVSTIHDNEFLLPTIREEIERLKDLDPILYEVYNLGNWMKVKGLVYPKFDTDYMPPEDCRTLYGIDFGFKDPMAVIEVKHDKDNLWLKELVYEREWTTSDLIEEIKPLQRERLVCDSANPNAIEELKRNGFKKVKKSRKGGRDYIKKGIDAVKQYNIHVHPESVNLLQEFKRYKYQVDQDGQAIDKPIDIFNHGMDAIRYAVDYAHRGQKGIRIIGMDEAY